MGDIELACHTLSWGPGNFVSAISEVAQAGYPGIEATPDVVGQFEDRPSVLSEILKENGLQLVAILSPSEPISTLSLEEEIERNLNIARFLQILGARYLVMYAPSVTGQEQIDEEDYALSADAINEIGLRTTEMGIRTCLHPQFGTLCESAAEIQKMQKLTNNKYVSFCMDTGHLQALNIAPASFYRDHHGRIPYIHFKDLQRMRKPRTSRKGARRTSRGEPVYCEVGKGSVNFARLVDYLTDYDYEGWVTVELDPPLRNPLRSARASLEYSNRQLDLVF